MVALLVNRPWTWDSLHECLGLQASQDHTKELASTFPKVLETLETGAGLGCRVIDIP